MMVAEYAVGSLARGTPAKDSPDETRRLRDVAVESGAAVPAGDEIVDEGTQNWRLILEAARALTAASQAPFSRLTLYQWIWARFPAGTTTAPASTPPSRA
jgi:hypothetical protein